MTTNNENTPNTGNNLRRPHDWIFFCDICGEIEWASKATKLSIYTGFGGAIVCPHCVYAIDYALVPYKAPPEKPVAWARTDTNYDTPASQVPNSFPPFDYKILPGSGPPGYYSADNSTWDKLRLTWDQLNVATWDTLGP